MNINSNDLKLYIEYTKSDKILEKKGGFFKNLSPFSSESEVLKIFSDFRVAAIESNQISKRWNRVKNKQEIIDGESYIKERIKKIYNGLKSFSGENSYKIFWVNSENEIGAHAYTTLGDRYSNRFKYRKTNVVYHFNINYEWATGLVDYQDITEKSNQENCPLIGLRKFSEKDFSIKGLGRENGPNKSRIKSTKWLKNNLKGNILFYAKWIKGNKFIQKQDGFIAARGSAKNNNLVIFHSKKSPEHALRGLGRKIEIKKNEERQKNNIKNGRGALFGQKIINLKQVQALTGWCSPGCKGWLDKYMDGKTKAPYYVVANAAHKACESGDEYGKKLLNLMGLSSPRINYNNPNPFTLWTK